MTAAELFRETIKKDGRPERQLKQYEALGFTFKDPVNTFIREGQVPGSVCIDKWGVTISFPKDAPGRTPIITEENKVCKDICRWRDYIKAPDIEAAAKGDWSEAIEDMKNIRADGQLATILMGTGIFEQCHFLMGIADTLTNLYEHPARMHELIDYILEYRLKYAKLLIDNLHPDAILSHDDWGTRNNLFMQPDVWREFFKEPYRKFYSYIRSQGVIVIHHADSYLAPIVDDMAEIGIQVWQGVLPENDIPALLRQLDGRMTLMGGIGAVVDTADSKEYETRAYVRQVLTDCCPYGHFIPSITYGMKGAIFKHVDSFIDAEIDKYNSELHIHRMGKSAAPRFAGKRVSDTTVTTDRTADKPESAVCTTEACNASVLDEISQAVQKGDRASIREAISRALQQGIKASDVIDKGLVVGMTQVGAAFSKGTVFVPEMLLAAKAMTAALMLLRPKLDSEAASHNAATQCKPRAVIGTIEGDLHDIGKNLVRIMMEGSGIEVIDLGSNVPAEDFVETAIEENCDIIACSSLLSTTMYNMKDVVDLAVERGIRDRVTIMVGGAPVSQEFCDEIGADIYTRDAGEAARQALAAIENHPLK